MSRFLIAIIGLLLVSPSAVAQAPVPSLQGCSPLSVETTVSGDFEGWTGKDEQVLVLANGQIWEVLTYAYEYHYAYMPKIVIYPTAQGCKARVESMRQAVVVKCLKQANTNKDQ